MTQLNESQLKDYVNSLREKIYVLEAEANPYANDPVQSKIYAAMSPEDKAWATKGGGKPDLTDPYIAARAPGKFKAVTQPAPAPTAGASAQAAPVTTPGAPGAQDDVTGVDAAVAAQAAQNAAPGAQDDVTGVDAAVAAQAATPAPTAGASAQAAPAAPAAPAKPTATPDPKVKALQDKLIAAGAKIQADGVMGPKTQAAMKQFPQAVSGNVPLPQGVAPSTAGAGRGTVNPTAPAGASAQAAPAAPAAPVMARPTNPMQANIWDRDYGKTHNPDGTPKAVKESAYGELERLVSLVQYR